LSISSGILKRGVSLATDSGGQAATEKHGVKALFETGTTTVVERECVSGRESKERLDDRDDDGLECCKRDECARVVASNDEMNGGASDMSVAASNDEINGGERRPAIA